MSCALLYLPVCGAETHHAVKIDTFVATSLAHHAMFIKTHFIMACHANFGV